VRAQLPRLVDLGLAGLVTAAGLAEIWVPFESRQGDGSATLSSLGAVVVGLALTQRRRLPLASGLVVLATWPVVMALSPVYVLFFGQFVPMLIAVFSIARHGRGREPEYGAAAGALVLLLTDLFVEELQSPGEIFFHWTMFAVVWGFGFGLQRFERRARESTRRAIDAEVAAAEKAMAAVLAERTRIARELHDIVAHAVSMIVVQAGAAEKVIDDDVEHVRRALTTIRLTGADALAEMRRVVSMLREVEEAGILEPQPGLDRVPTLVDEARATGLEVDLEVVGQARPLAAGVDLAAYRIVQESLTNVLRHAGASQVSIRLVYGSAEVSIEVVDNGKGVDGTAEGNGLVGMRERAALYGGSIDVGATNGSGRGLRVHAVLPTGTSA
jgi:signal transduction histidine kinase